LGDAACLCRAGMVNRTWHTVAADNAYSLFFPLLLFYVFIYFFNLISPNN
jgi:hypothetical protein